MPAVDRMPDSAVEPGRDAKVIALAVFVAQRQLSEAAAVLRADVGIDLRSELARRLAARTDDV